MPASPALRAALGVLIAATLSGNVLAQASRSAAPARAASASAPAERFPATLAAYGTTLQLNGSGIRYKLIFPVYEAGLYTTQKVETAEQFFSAPGAKRFHAVALRDVPANELSRMLLRGVRENNAEGDVGRQSIGLAQIGGIFGNRDKLAKGQSFGIDYIPGSGTQLYVDGQPQGEPVRDPAFYPLVMRIWLGTVPADTGLKDALLGRRQGTGPRNGEDQR